MQPKSPHDQPTIESLCRTMEALRDPTRLRILFMLAEGPRDVTSLCNAFGLPQPTVSHHLGLLRMAAMVTAQRMGKRMIYSLAQATASNDMQTLGFPAGSHTVHIRRVEPLAAAA